MKKKSCIQNFEIFFFYFLHSEYEREPKKNQRKQKIPFKISQEFIPKTQEDNMLHELRMNTQGRTGWR